MSIRLSIIMPVYNCEQYLEAALRSVLSQSVTDLEIIAVDDCSNDASCQILQRVAQEDPRLRILQNEQNVGVAAVRNRALEQARGEYVAFCDADDTVPEGAYEALLSAIGECDVAIGGFEDLLYTDDTERERTACPVGAACRDSVFLSLFSVPCLWTKLFRTSFLKDNALRFDDDMTIGEDVVFLARAAALSPEYAVTDASVYRHIRRQSSRHRSLTRTFDLASFQKHVECRQRLLEICGSDPHCTEFVYLQFAWDLNTYLCQISDPKEREAAFALFQQFMCAYPYENTAALFLAKTGVPYSDFCKMSADEYFEYRNSVLPREQVANEFLAGTIGLRWIWIYLKGWLKFKLSRRNP